MEFSTDVKAFLDPIPRRFAEVFMTADPTHCAPVERAQLEAALPQRRALFESAGIGPLRLVGGSDERLDDHYVLARTVWRGDSVDGDHLDLRSTYILHRVEDSYEVVFYLNHQNLPLVLAARAAGNVD